MKRLFQKLQSVWFLLFLTSCDFALAILFIAAIPINVFFFRFPEVRSYELAIDHRKISNSYITYVVEVKDAIINSVSDQELQTNIAELASHIGARVTGSEKEEEAALWIKSQFENYNYTTEIQEFNLAGSGESQNVIAYLGNEFGDEETAIVIGAHYDTVADSPGAMDNASGVSAVLEIAKIFSEANVGLDYDLVFVLFGAEECRGKGCSAYHQGSKFYVGELSQEERDEISLMIDLDCIGGVDEMQIMRDEVLSKQFGQEFYEILEGFGIGDIEFLQSKNWSDQWSFDRAGIPAVFLYTPSCCFLHKQIDTVSKVDIGRVALITKSVVKYILDN